ncbi:MAG: CpsB/CapC family capsule biosynthesis tyrosine phosphatase [Bacteroidia bacterium]
MFKSLFGKFSKTDSTPVDFTEVKTDMHSHLIPGIDDGAKTIEDSITLVKRLYELGYRKAITTPHIMSDFYKNTPEIIHAGLEKVRHAIANENIEFQVDAAAEYYLDDGFLNKLENDKLLTFGNNYLLFEISYINCPDNLREIIFQMQVHGYKPIMAHPERYPFWFNKFEEYQSFRDQGVLLQINANSLSGYYGFEAKKVAEKLIDNEMVDLIGTDMHNLTHADALKKTAKEKSFRKLLGFNLINKYL